MSVDPTQRRLRICFVLATIALVSLFVARGVTQLAAVALLPLAPRSSPVAPAARAVTTLGPAHDPTAIVERSIFGSAPRGGAPSPPLDPSAAAPTCGGALRLVGAFYSPERPTRSFAAISDLSGQVRVYRRGMSVDGRTIDTIGADSVDLSAPDLSCTLTMFEQPPRVAPTQPMVAVGAVTGSLGSARAVLHREAGRVVGVNVYGISRESILGRLGLQSGDTLRTINGLAITSPDEALVAYARLRNADHLSVSVMRRGQPANIELDLR